MRKRSVWTEEEVELLKEKYPCGRLQDLVELFNRPYPIIHYKARSLGLRNDRKWTVEQIELLKRIYPTQTQQELENIIGKPFQTIMDKANRLKILENLLGLSRRNNS